MIGLPEGLRFLRGRLSLTAGKARFLIRAVIASAAAGVLTVGIVLMIYRDDIFGAVDPYPILMTVLFGLLLFALSPIGNFRRIVGVGRVPAWVLLPAGLLLGLGLSAFSEGARGVVDQTGTVSQVTYRAMYRLLGQEGQGFSQDHL